MLALMRDYILKIINLQIKAISSIYPLNEEVVRKMLPFIVINLVGDCCLVSILDKQEENPKAVNLIVLRRSFNQR